MNFDIKTKNGNLNDVSKTQSLKIFDIQKKKLSENYIEFTIPTFQRPKKLIRAIDSVLAQSNENYIVTVIDNDNARDNETEKILTNKYRGKLRYFKNETNLGMVGNWNKCLEISQAKNICMLHDDDLIKPNFLDVILKITNSIDDFGILSVRPQKVTDNHLISRNNTSNKKSMNLINRVYKGFRINSQEFIRKISYINFFSKNFVSPCAMIIDVEKAKNLNGWSFEEYPSHDYLFNARMAYFYSVYYYNPKTYISIYSKGEGASSLKQIQQKFNEQHYLFYITNIRNVSKRKHFFYTPLLLYSKKRTQGHGKDVTFFVSYIYRIWLLLDHKIHSKHFRWLK